MKASQALIKLVLIGTVLTNGKRETKDQHGCDSFQIRERRSWEMINTKRKERDT